MKDLLRSNDLIMRTWHADDGLCAWLLLRNGQIFFNMILRNQRGLYLVIEDWAQSSDKNDCDITQKVMKVLGFVTSQSIFMTVESAKTAGKLSMLQVDIEVYRKDVDRQKQLFEAQQAEQKKQQVKSESKDVDSKSKVTPIK